MQGRPSGMMASKRNAANRASLVEQRRHECGTVACKGDVAQSFLALLTVAPVIHGTGTVSGLGRVSRATGI